MEFRSRRLAFIAAVLSICGLANPPLVCAGPPLVVDDPVTLDRDHVELFTSFLYTLAGSARSYASPSELTIGLATGWECSLNGAYQYQRDPSSTPKIVNGLLSLEVGTKFRLLTESPDVPMSLALSAKFRCPTSNNSKFADQGKSSGDGFLIVGKTWGDFTLNGNIGFGVGGAQNRDAVSNAWFFGLAAQRIFAKKYTLFAETYAVPQVGRFRDAVISADGGLLWDLSDRYRITVLLGRGFRPGGADFLCNLGFLLSLGPTTPAAKPAK
jgi:hypothetical protein